MKLNVISSTGVSMRSLKILVLGRWSTRKTEWVLRHFPDVLEIDAEGNAPMCIGVPEIPEFLLLSTKDANEAIAAIDAVGANQLKFSDGRKVQTVCLDTATTFKDVRVEWGTQIAEQREIRSHRDPEAATIDQGLWTKIKRPLKEMPIHANNSGIPYVVFLARVSDEYEKKPGARPDDAGTKVGERADVVKGLEHDVNIAFRFDYAERGNPASWFAEVVKVQGVMSKDFPLGKHFTNGKLMFDLLAKYRSAVINTATGLTQKSDASTAAEQLKGEEKEAPNAAKQALYRQLVALDKTRFVANGRVDIQAIDAFLAANNLTADPAKTDEIVAAVKAKLNGQPA